MPTRFPYFHVTAALLTVPLLACGTTDDPDDIPGDAHSIDGTIVAVGGGVPPQSATVFVAWNGETSNGDHLYKYGEGAATSTTFFVDVALPLPALATYGGEVAIGNLAAAPSSLAVPDGILDDELTNQLVGWAGQHVLVYRPNAAPIDELPWVDDFPVGLSCGACVPQAGAAMFVPVACDEMKLEVGPAQAISKCEWR